MSLIKDTLSVDNEVLRGLITWSSILFIKMIAMSFITSIHRFINGTFDNPEDLILRPGSQVQRNENVERVRRGHRNDMENIYIFVIAGFFYTFTEPIPSVALNLFRVVGICRILHSFVYVIYPISQPFRGAFYMIPLWITIYMIITTLVHFIQL